MSRMMLGAAMGFMAGAALMMTATGRAMHNGMKQDMRKAKRMMQEMEAEKN
ncbi:MAG: hypothetical protein IKK57_02820 [Clostridia bacterium]|nr:hypothetical protein [Clostridia bacterium]